MIEGVEECISRVEDMFRSEDFTLYQGLERAFTLMNSIGTVCHIAQLLHCPELSETGVLEMGKTRDNNCMTIHMRESGRSVHQPFCQQPGVRYIALCGVCNDVKCVLK